jgi:hypothetical protein
MLMRERHTARNRRDDLNGQRQKEQKNAEAFSAHELPATTI